MIGTKRRTITLHEQGRAERLIVAARSRVSGRRLGGPGKALTAMLRHADAIDAGRADRSPLGRGRPRKG